jgi:hypothetical protein
MTHEHVVAGLARAVRSGALTADAVALEARKFADTDDQPTGRHDLRTAADTTESKVVSLTERRLAHLPADTRPPPSVAAYDQLLRRHRPAGRPAPQQTAEGTTP